MLVSAIYFETQVEEECTIFVRFNVPPLFIVPPPREREHVYPGDLYPLLDCRKVVTHGEHGSTHGSTPQHATRYGK